MHALERAATVAALLITREQAVAAVENKYRGDFLRDVFLRRAGGEAYVAEHAQAFGWDLGRPVVIVVAELDPDAIEGAAAPGPQRRSLAGPVRAGVAPGQRTHRQRHRLASTSPPRW